MTIPTPHRNLIIFDLSHVSFAVSDNQRRSPRKPLITDVEYKSAGAQVRARLANIGTLGVYIETDSPLVVGMHLELTFVLPGGHPIETKGVVVHQQTGRGMGVAFVSMRAEDINQISAYVESE